MPVRPEMRDLYPPDWPEISDRIRFGRAGGRCECDGLCGRPLDHLDPADGRCRNVHGQPRWRGAPNQCAVILTTAHLDHHPPNVDDDNLRGLCEGCHLHYDRAHHAATREAARVERLGLVPLFELPA